MTAQAHPAAVGASDSVRTILALHPETAPVFERHGLLGCGGHAGPDERLDLFAAVHRVDLPGLLGELDAALRAPPPAEPAPTAADSAAATLYRRFLWAALLCTLTLGATFGAYNLLVIHLALGSLPAEHNWVHASFQLFGFVLLFVMGVAYHTLPRFFGTPLRGVLAARSSLWLAASGLLLRGYGQFGQWLPGTAPSLALGAVLQLAAIGCFAAVLAATWRAARAKIEPFHLFLAAGLLGWLTAAAFLVLDAVASFVGLRPSAGGAVLLRASGVAALAAGDSAAARIFHEPLYLAALFGGTLPFIEGMLLRTGPVFLGLRAVPRRTALAVLALGEAGAALAVAGALGLSFGGSGRALDAGLIATAAAAVAFTWAIGAFHARQGHAGDRDPAFPQIVRHAFFWLCVFALLAALQGGLDLAGVAPPSLLYDGLRHAFALGFVTLMIFAMAGRIVPIFGGASLRWPALRSAGTLSISVGVALRELEVVASLGWPWLLRISAWSGAVAATGVALAAASILATLRAAGIEATVPEASAGPVEIGPDANVFALVTAHPEALPLLVAAGFTQLASPLARRTLARAVTLRQACRMHGQDAEALAAQIREACRRVHLRTDAALRSRRFRPPPPAPAPKIGSAPPLVTLGLPQEEAGFAGRRAEADRPQHPIDRARVLEVIRHVYDPELGLNLVDLGLIYDVEVRAGNAVHVRMTLTSPHCPHGEGLAEEVDSLVRGLPNAGDVDVEVTFEPPWSPERMTPEARASLGLA